MQKVHVLRNGTDVLDKYFEHSAHKNASVVCMLATRDPHIETACVYTVVPFVPFMLFVRNVAYLYPNGHLRVCRYEDTHEFILHVTEDYKVPHWLMEAHDLTVERSE